MAELRYLCSIVRHKHERRTEFHLTSCAGKQPFASRERAVSTISNRLRHEVHAYHCHACGHWHIGSMYNSNEIRKRVKLKLNKAKEVGCE